MKISKHFISCEWACTPKKPVILQMSRKMLIAHINSWPELKCLFDRPIEQLPTPALRVVLYMLGKEQDDASK